MRFAVDSIVMAGGLRDDVSGGTVTEEAGGGEGTSASDSPDESPGTLLSLLGVTLRQAVDAIVIVDAQGRMRFANATAKRLAIARPDDVTLQAAPDFWGEAFEPEGRKLDLDEWPIVRSLRGEITSGHELHMVRGDGQEYDILVSSAPVRNAAEQIVGAVATFTDITERKRSERAVRRINEELERRVVERTSELEAANRRLEEEIAQRREAEAALRQSQTQLQDMVDNSSTVIQVKDEEARYLLVNRKWEEVFHRHRADVLGRSVEELFPAEIAIPLRQNDHKVLTDERPLIFEERVPHDDAIHTYLVVKFALRRPDGTAYGVCGIATDITEKTQVQAELRQSQAELSALLENTRDAIWSVDREYRVTASNSVARNRFRSRFGNELEIGSTMAGKVPPVVAETLHGLYDKALAGQRLVLEQSYRIDGDLRYFLVSLNPIVEGETITGVTVFNHEITEHKRTEMEARQRQAELAHILRVGTVGEVAAGLAHEINQPLGAIAHYAQGCARRIRSGTMAVDEVAAIADEIAREALRAAEVLRRLRRLVRKEEPRREETDLNEIVRDAASILAPTARDLSVALSVVAAEIPPIVVGDGVQLEQVAINLMINAIESVAAADGPTREVVARVEYLADGRVAITISDSGLGLDSSASSDIFDAFYTTKPDGLGMGLAISRSIVEAHGGQLSATPNPAGGAIFRVALRARG
jgi:PAS domain S-box-containing protein